MDEVRSLVGSIALCCVSDVLTLLVGGVQPVRNLSWNKWLKKTKGDRLNAGSSGKWLLKVICNGFSQN